MPNRIIKETICTSDEINGLSDAEEAFFYRLMVNCDDFGLLDARPQILASKCYPLRTVDINCIQMMLDALHRISLVILYEVDGKPYLQLKNWAKHQQTRAKKSKYPLPNEGICKHLLADDINCNQLQADVHVNVNEYVNVSDQPPAVSSPKKPSKPKLVRIPPDFVVSDRVKKWAAEKHHGNLERHFEHFASTAKAKGYEYADWDEGFMKAVRENWAKVPIPPVSSGNPMHDFLRMKTA